MTETYQPYFAEDTSGVHFQVLVDGRHISAHVARSDLVRLYGPCESAQDCMTVFRLHERFLRDAAVRHVRQFGPDTVILTHEKVIRFAIDDAHGSS